MTIQEGVLLFMYEAGSTDNPMDIFLILFSAIAVIIVLCLFVFNPLSLVSFTFIRGLMVFIAIWAIRIYFFLKK